MRISLALLDCLLTDAVLNDVANTRQLTIPEFLGTHDGNAETADFNVGAMLHSDCFVGRTQCCDAVLTR